MTTAYERARQAGLLEPTLLVVLEDPDAGRAPGVHDIPSAVVASIVQDLDIGGTEYGPYFDAADEDNPPERFSIWLERTELRRLLGHCLLDPLDKDLLPWTPRGEHAAVYLYPECLFCRHERLTDKGYAEIVGRRFQAISNCCAAEMTPSEPEGVV